MCHGLTALFHAKVDPPVVDHLVVELGADNSLNTQLKSDEQK